MSAALRQFDAAGAQRAGGALTEQPAGDRAQDHVEDYRAGADAAAALCAFAVDPASFGGLQLCGLPGPGRDAALAALKHLLPKGAPMIRIPGHVSDDRLLGGLDLGATLHGGRPVVQRGLLAEADGGAVIVSMAERLCARVLAHLTGALDTRHVALERDGLSSRVHSRFAIVALDESLGADEAVAEALSDRLAFRIWTDYLSASDLADIDIAADGVAYAREHHRRVAVPDDVVAALCAAAVSFGIASMRASIASVAVARVLAALGGRDEATPDDAQLAARLVLAPRARQLPPQPAEPDSDEQDAPPESSRAEQPNEAPPQDSSADRPDDEQQDDNAASREPDDADLEEMVVDAARAALPPGLLASLDRGARARRAPVGRAGAKHASRRRGRPIGTLAGRPDGQARLNVLATLKAAAPWQRLRGADQRRLRISPEDFRVTRFRHKTQTTTIFVVDASGSSAMQRLAEVKGAIELLLADCYVRRDQVALIAFRGSGAETLLAPTRSLTRARRQLCDLRGGGPTPLAAALDAARELADSVRKKGHRPVVILLTDGRGNVGRDGTPGHADAQEHALAAARELAATGTANLLVDISRRPRPRGQQLASALAARYLPLPYASAAALAEAVQASTVA